jgi:hypothetical protein
MRVTSSMPDLPPDDVVRMLAGLPEPDDYDVVV